MTKDVIEAATLDRIDNVPLNVRHLTLKAFKLFDRTDLNDCLVTEEKMHLYPGCSFSMRGNVFLFDNYMENKGLLVVKDSPTHLYQLLENDDSLRVKGTRNADIVGAGLHGDIDADDWCQLYGTTVGVGDTDELLVEYRQLYRAQYLAPAFKEPFIMSNTWGDRSQDSKVNEEFCLSELELASRLGIAVFQIDDGWQSGKSPNSKVAKGSFRNIWDNPDYWTPDPVKYPRGLDPVVDRARALRMEVGLWYNPSVQNDFADWEKDAEAIIGLWKKYGIRIFKIDGLQIPTKQAENNLRRLFDRVREATDDAVVFNLDATAGRRAGYHYFGEYGNIFLENRYTDWGNYYPYHTLRNLWMLSRYVPAEKIQTEFLNPWRNADKYAEGDPFAPANYDFGYLAAISFAG